MSKDCIIYDFETLSQDQRRGVVLCVAGIRFNEDRYLSDNPYTYKELLDESVMMKFSVREQVETYGRTTDKSTLDWWSSQGSEAREMLKESEADVSIREIEKFFKGLIPDAGDISRVYTRGNTFDPIFTESIFDMLRLPHPYNWWSIRDTRSMIDGLSFGAGIKNSFMVPGLEDSFVHHDPNHDVAMDIMRMQYLARETML